MQPPSSSARTRRSATHGAAGGRVVQRGEQGERRLVVGPALDPQGPLPDRRQEPGRAEPLGDVAVQPEPAQARLGQDHARRARRSRAWFSRVSTFPRTPDDVQVGPGVEQLRPAPERAGADRRPVGQGVEGPVARGDQGVGHVLAGRDGPQDQAVGPLGRQVLQAVDGDLDEPLEQGPLDLLGEQARSRRSPPGASSGRGRPGS